MTQALRSALEELDMAIDALDGAVANVQIPEANPKKDPDLVARRLDAQIEKVQQWLQEKKV